MEVFEWSKLPIGSATHPHGQGSQQLMQMRRKEQIFIPFFGKEPPISRGNR